MDLPAPPTPSYTPVFPLKCQNEVQIWSAQVLQGGSQWFFQLIAMPEETAWEVKFGENGCYTMNVQNVFL